MSFFRSIRSSITRGRSSSRDTTPVRGSSSVGGTSNETSRPGSVLGNGGNSSRRDSVESRTDSLFNRSDTFILNNTSDLEEEEDAALSQQSNTSTLEKKTKTKSSKKSKVLSKFSTFTKRKKTPSSSGNSGAGTPTLDASSYEHHPSDNATNTYYKWQTSDSGNGGMAPLDYDSQSDPFNFLYEQQSSRKTLQNGNSGSGGVSNMATPTPTPTITPTSASEVSFDSSTYRKGKMPTQLRERLEQLKSNAGATVTEVREADETTLAPLPSSASAKETEADKYKTITLNSFRRSFREKLLQQQKEAPYNPAWFVAVEQKPTASTAQQQQKDKEKEKENRPDFLVFENDNYRPGSRSPVRGERPSSLALSAGVSVNGGTGIGGVGAKRQSRSPVKRNETFRIERPFTPTVVEQHHQPSSAAAPSIRVEFKNSITPHMPGRLVPVGVAKPMQSTATPTASGLRSSWAAPSTAAAIGTKAAKTPISLTHLTNVVRSATPHHALTGTTMTTPTTPAASAGAFNGVERSRAGRYQTLVQIRNEVNAAASRQQQQLHSQPPPYQPPPSTAASTTAFAQLRAPPTRIQLGGDLPITTTTTAAATKTLSPLLAQRRLHSAAGTRYSLAATPTSGQQPLHSSYELYKKATQQQQQQQAHKSTHMNVTPSTATTTTRHSSGMQRPPTYFGGNIGTAIANNNNSTSQRLFGGSATRGGGLHNTNNNRSTSTTTIKLPASRSYAYGGGSYISGSGIGIGGAHYPSEIHAHQQLHHHQQQQQQHQQPQRHRVIVPTQRRSRSPIKIPWR